MRWTTDIVGHKVACIAPSNVAVDTDANAVWKGLTDEERKTIKCLRLETDGAERAQRLTKIGYAHYSGAKGEEDQLPEYLGPKEAQDNPAIRNVLDKLCVEYSTCTQYATAMFKKYEDMSDAYKAIQNYEGIKQSYVPNGMTLDFRMWEITDEDQKKAEVEDQDTVKSLTTEQATAQVASGALSVAKFDKSRKYRECINNYISKKGFITKAERTALEDETNALIS